MAEAVELARLHGAARWTGRSGRPRTAGRFAEGDLAAILTHQAARRRPAPTSRAGEDHTLAQGTAGWAGFGPRGE